MIKLIISILLKIIFAALVVSILSVGVAMFALSFGKTEIENQLNEMVIENKSEIVKALENRLSLNFEYENLIVSYEKYSINDLKIQFSFTDVQMAQVNDPLPVDIDGLNIEIDLMRSILNQLPAITAIIINGSDIQFSHNNESGYMINNIPIAIEEKRFRDYIEFNSDGTQININWGEYQSGYWKDSSTKNEIWMYDSEHNYYETLEIYFLSHC